MVIYLDGVMGLNFLVDWLLLLGVNRLSGFPPGFGRTAAAAAVGGGYAGMCLIPGFSFLGSVLWRTVSLGLMSMTAFGMNSGALRRGALFVLLSMAMGGLALRLESGNLPEILGCGLMLGGLCQVGFRGRAGRKRFVTIKMTHGIRTCRVNALVDTGNTLTDPLTGESVIVADAKTGEELLGLERSAFKDPATTITAHPEMGFRLIPCRTVGQSGALLLGLRCDSVRIENREAGNLVAFSPVEFESGEYGALTGGCEWER